MPLKACNIENNEPTMQVNFYGIISGEKLCETKMHLSTPNLISSKEKALSFQFTAPPRPDTLKDTE